MELYESDKPLSKKEIKDFENLIGFELPNSFKEFYFKANGGVLDPDRFFNGIHVQVFLPIKYGEDPIEEQMKYLVESKLLSVGYLPFAYSNGSARFCLDLRTENYGVVYLLRMDSYELEYIASDFALFLDGLIEEDNWADLNFDRCRL